MDPMSSAIKLIKHLVHEKRYVWLISKKVYLIGHVKYVKSFLYRNPVTNLQIAFSYLSKNGYKLKKKGGGVIVWRKGGGGGSQWVNK